MVLRKIGLALCLLVFFVPAANAINEYGSSNTIVRNNPSHTVVKKKYQSLWRCPSQWSVNVCEALVINWHQWHYYYQQYYYTQGMNYHHLTWDCWKNPAWTNPSLLARCNLTGFWTGVGQYAANTWLSTNFNVFHQYWSAQLPNCSRIPSSWAQSYPSISGLLTTIQTWHAPPYECMSQSRVPGDLDESGSW